MNNREYVVFMHEELKWSWGDIGVELGMHEEAARSLYRRVKGTHEHKPEFSYSSKKIDYANAVRIAFPTDIHAPFHDKYAVALAVNIVK